MTDLDDPFGRTGGTQLRPRPGAGRRGAADAGRPRPPNAGHDEVDSIPVASGLLGFGLNPLVQAASPLLLLAGRLRGGASTGDASELRRTALDDLRAFEDQARQSGVSNDIVLAARYALCAALDEAVLATPWGGQSEWSQHPLLVTLHRETWGGEKFFDVLERVSREPAKFIDLMELQYLCLAFGFAGKYHVRERGHEQLAEITHGLYRRIREVRGAPAAELSLRWQGLEHRQHPVTREVPWWVVAAAGLALAAATFTFYYTGLARSAAPIQATLAKLGRQQFDSPEPAAPQSGPTLKRLLASEEAAGVVRIDEQGGRTVVTLLSSALFASGSADVNGGAVGTLQRVAAALERVPGRVLVVGHTDGQQVRSLRFQDNFELSRERAVSVARVLQRGVTVPARVSWTGVGSSEPLEADESRPENRARNRRVEIVHVRGS
jgi:type VI secretion system protein ImpK